MTTQEISRLVNEKNDAIIALEDEMTKEWPVGSKIFVLLKSKQIIPTAATVVFHDGIDEMITVSLCKNKRDNFKKWKRVKFRDICKNPTNSYE